MLRTTVACELHWAYGRPTLAYALLLSLCLGCSLAWLGAAADGVGCEPGMTRLRHQSVDCIM